MLGKLYQHPKQPFQMWSKLPTCRHKCSQKLFMHINTCPHRLSSTQDHLWMCLISTWSGRSITIYSLPPLRDYPLFNMRAVNKPSIKLKHRFSYHEHLLSAETILRLSHSIFLSVILYSHGNPASQSFSFPICNFDSCSNEQSELILCCWVAFCWFALLG